MSTARAHFDRLFKRELRDAQRAALIGAISHDPTIGDLLSCLDDGAYSLHEDDDLTVGDLLEWPGEGPTVAEAVTSLGLPLDSPLDVAARSVLARPLRDLLAASDG